MLGKYGGKKYKPNALVYYLPNACYELDFIIAYGVGHTDRSDLFKCPAVLKPASIYFYVFSRRNYRFVFQIM
jgi:hypothetical protein